MYVKREALEPLAAALMDIGVVSVVIEDPEELKSIIAENSQSWDMVDDRVIAELDGTSPNIKAYVSDSEDGAAMLGRITDLAERLRGGGDPLYDDLRAETVFVKDENWEYDWKKFFSPIETGKLLYVRPVWDDTPAPEGRIAVAVDPGSSFGSGQHETTRMCLEELETYAPGAAHVMDIGCGSGILSVAAAKLGAERITAVDIDENAVAATKEISAVNGTADKLTVLTADLTDGIDDKADVIVANIFAGTIIRLCGDIRRTLLPKGVFISTGIIADRLDEVKKAYAENGFEIINERAMGEWRLLTGRLG